MDDPLAPEALASINALLRNMEQESDLFQRLAALLDRQREVLKRVGAPGLVEVRAETDELLGVMETVGEARSASLAEVGSHFGIAADAVSVSAVLDRLPPADRRELESLRRQLSRVAAEVRRRGEVAHHLLGVSLDTIHGIVQMVRREAEGSVSLYGGEGAVAKGSGRGSVLQETA